MTRHALVFGASGLIGRHLMLTLAADGADVTAAVRTPESGARVERWLRDHGLARSIATAIVDFDAEEILAGGPSAFADVTEIHQCAGDFRFGMSVEEARRGNVDLVEKVVDFAAGIPDLQRVVYVSGYRVGGQDPAGVPWSAERRAATYAELGAYEASKMEADAVFQARAAERGVPWTMVNPATVIGDSRTGETDQQIGIASSIGQLWEGRLAALPGDERTFLPVLTVDHLAAFMVAAAADPAAAGHAYWVLDDDTPPLADLLGHVGRHLGVKVPRLRLPVGLLTRLPQSITKADPETLTFLSSDRYPTASARELAARHGIQTPDVRVSLERWGDHLAAHRFGAAPAGDRRFVDVGGVRTFEVGVAGSDRVILPGLPVNADTWAGVARSIGARAVDLPGLGLSGGSGVEDWDTWLASLVGADGPVHLVGHSVGAAAAVLAADRFPGRVGSLTLVAPFFLQGRMPASVRVRPLVRHWLRHTDPLRLSRQLTGSDLHAEDLVSSVGDLRRRTAGRVAAQLARAGSEQWRGELREALARFDGPVRIVTGSDDPLASDVAGQLARRNVELVIVPGAGHHPQLTHGGELAAVLGVPVGSAAPTLQEPTR
ncbi:alpha/beta fold hydrolase [Nocardioides jiangxiensis]|uniref:Alpha/beta fold hydrolase n=1 Tax=Nocardioides jiangxiensis TaxID=3064524 RepID=A0ABT9B0F5_9ACTN|nr:alpha/beta fold hydrolase [Nocardioides sp. WY-20]MDO7868207.1 alpha/beta fold hydrolase [Nocardioides sp. WY-20]